MAQQLPQSDKNINIQSGQEQEQEQMHYCNFCKKPAFFRCSNCLTTPYCTSEHQRADWPSHQRRCIHPTQKVNQLKKYINNGKIAMFEKISNEQLIQTQLICQNILKVSQQVLQKQPNKEMELLYGSLICAYIKLQIKVKNFNEAQDILNTYIKKRSSFLKDLSNIPSKKDNPDDYNNQQILNFVNGKLKLISVLANMTHQLVRNSVNIVEILLKHCVKFYGEDSLEVSNIYFYLGHYLYFMNQRNKALACFLVAARIRGKDGATCCFNISKILKDDAKYQKAIQYFNKSIQMIQSNGKDRQLLQYIYEGMAYCYKKLNHFDNSVLYLQKALCQIKSKKIVSQREKPIKLALKYLSQVLKNQFKDDVNMTLPKQRIKTQQKYSITNQNLKDYWNKDNKNSEQARRSQWQTSFRKQHDFMKFQSKIPLSNLYAEKFLFQNHFIEDKTDKQYTVPNGISWIKIDLPFMEKLTARQVRFLDQLNLQLMECKQKSAVMNILDNCKFLQAIDQQKTEKFYLLNPDLVTKQKNLKIDLQDIPLEQTQFPNKNKGLKTPKLDLSKLQGYKYK